MGLTEIVEELKERERKFRNYSRWNFYGSLITLGFGTYYISEALLSLQSKEDLAKLVLPLLFLPISISFYNKSRFWSEWAQEIRERYSLYFESEE